MEGSQVTKVQATPRSQDRLENAMYLQRPSSGRSQDVRHILAHCFRDLYMRDALHPETVKNLQVSKGGDDPYHEKYVEGLQKIYNEWQRRMEEAAMLERHIMQAQARAMSADERALHRSSKACDQYDSLGLPPGRAHFRSCIDTQLLRDHDLLTPEDYSTEEPGAVPPPSGPPIPAYARETLSSQQHSRENFPESQPLHPFETSGSLEFPSFLSDGDTEEIVDEADKPAEEEKFPSRSAWKAYMSTEEREEARNELARLHAKVNYMRNPRYLPPSATGNQSIIKSSKRRLKEINVHPKPVKESEEEAPVFLASPPVVVFKDYKVGQVYEITLELKNVSTVLRQCRAMPPSSSYFSVGLGQFPGENGLVAPGMSCHFPIRFAPDSLKDYDDVIQINTLSSKPFIIHIQGRREPPSLTLPPVLDVGYCLVRGFQVTQFAIRNEGGPGRFCIMPRALWPATNFKSVMTNGSVVVPPFELRPSTLELDREGQVVKVSLAEVERGEAEALPGELCDRSAQHLIKFDDLNPFTYTERCIKVHNCIDVELPFQWMVYKPQMPRPKFPSDEDVLPVPPNPTRDPEEDRVPELDSVFSVHPQSGVLMPAETAEFRVTFAPPVISEFHNVIHLLIQQVPLTSQQGPRLSEDGTPAEENNDELAELMPADGAVPPFRDLTGLEIELKGNSIPLNVVLHPYALYLPGSHLVATTVKKLFTMANHSFSTITFQWEPVHEDKMIMEVEPPFGELDPGMAMDLELSLTGSEPGHISHTLFCYVLNLEEPLHLHVEADIKGPEITIDEPSLNFGLVRLGDTVEKEMTLTSMTQLITKFSLEDKPLQPDSDDDMAASEFTFIPASGELRPLEKKTVTVQFKPVSLGAFAEVQQPVVCLLECDINLPEVYVGVPVVFNVVLFNQTLLPTTFSWGKPEGEQVAECDIEIQEPAGEIRSREKRPVAFSFIAARQGDYSDVQVPCTVAGQESPLFVNLNCMVQGLSVSYMSSEDGQNTSSEDCSINCGDNVPLGQIVKRYLHICNQTAITADFSVMMDQFAAAQPNPPHAERSGESVRPMLARTPNLADPLSKTPAKSTTDLKTMMLCQGLGAAFHLQPMSGTLQPFGEQVIEVTAYSDMWGSYTDNIVCKVGKLDNVCIPVSMTVKGCPLQFQMTAANPEQEPVIRFGTLVAGVAPVTRTMRVNNTSPFDIRVDWVVYNHKEEDERLVDLLISYGRTFPPRDPQGNEIVPQPPAPPRLIRAATDMIPNSPDTRHSISRTPSQDKKRDRPKVVSIFLRPHDGVEEFVPYDIKPRQLTVPARGHATVYMTFTPPSPQEIMKDTDCVSYALGYMSLDSSNVNIDGKVARTEAYETAALRVDYSAHVKPALLTIEETDEEGMCYQSAMSDILDGDKVRDESLRICSAMLSNTTQTPLTFRLKVKPPFVMVDLDPASNSDHLTRAIETGFHTLMPRHSIMVKVALRVTPTMLSDYQRDYGEDDWESAMTDHRLTITDHLIVEFNNTTEQKLPLHATIAVPQMGLSKSELDFGTCLVGQRRELQLIISNTTASHCCWFASFESKSSTCTQDTFQISPTHGKLEAYITHVSDSKTLLNVYFTAKHAEDYEAVILFQGSLGESHERLYVRGRGSYDGKHEAILSI
ncbi:hypothetical protein BaRGS_00000007 [Batillaria attramentaria]|uniref:Deleted in lung and esophageal cancer protein 1 Ig-like domain-containing protein n=1 Tax=Batillaria attramentaria TaxID=370345 RepID=A0ABD0MBF8_9CAEN